LTEVEPLQFPSIQTEEIPELQFRYIENREIEKLIEEDVNVIENRQRQQTPYNCTGSDLDKYIPFPEMILGGRDNKLFVEHRISIAEIWLPINVSRL
jgi:hypothetical protein